jgi:predicted O-linked N-acetylglucosamine transferase (SPINDLY family)
MALTSPQTLTLDDALQQAVTHHRAGRLPEAEQLYRAVLQTFPNQPDAHHNLGLLAGQVGQQVAGLPHLKAALDAQPTNPQYVMSYAGALSACGSRQEALDVVMQAHARGVDTPQLQSLRQTLESVNGRAHSSPQVPNNRVAPVGDKPSGGISLTDLMKGTKAASQKHRKPGKAQKHHASSNDGQYKAELVALFNAARFAELEIRVNELLKHFADDGVLWQFLGVAYQLQGKDGMQFLQKAAALSPGNPEVQCNLAFAWLQRGQLDSALAAYQKALSINPNHAVAHVGIGDVLMDRYETENAVGSYRRALEINPDYADAHNNLGNALKALGRDHEAITHFRRALELKPDCAEIHNNLGNSLKNIGQVEQALSSYQRAIQLKPEYANAYNGLGLASLIVGDLAQAAMNFRTAIKLDPGFDKAHGNLLFAQNYLCEQSADALLADAHAYGALVANKASPFTSWRVAREPGRCLRVGLVSGDLRIHSVGHFIESVLSSLATQSAGRIEIVAYYNNDVHDVLSERIKNHCHGWRVVYAMNDAQLAGMIHDDAIDILIDLSGHSDKSRLPMFAWKPAPVQASWLGYFATTGVAAVDYFIADPWTAPPGVDLHFTEKVLRLPETYLCFSVPEFDLPVTSLPALANGYVTFGCFNNLAKMNDKVTALWARVLHAVPNSRLMLKTKQLNDFSVRRGVLQRFAQHGIDASRLVLENAAPRVDLLASYNRIDIALDPFPYPGGTTSVEALWMAVPVLSLAGDRFLSHLGESILHNAGLPDWIAADADDYVAKAVEHTKDLQKLAALRGGLRQQVLASPLFDAPRFAHHFEKAMRDIWTTWCRQQQGGAA